jgi:hypothetical protein
MRLKVGSRYRSQVCNTELIIVRALPDEVELECGGHPIIDVKAQAESGLSVREAADGGTQLGKRYTDASGKLEVLVTKAGRGTLSLDGEALTLKEAKPLPASD